jgi:hypothetical protein
VTPAWAAPKYWGFLESRYGRHATRALGVRVDAADRVWLRSACGCSALADRRAGLLPWPLARGQAATLVLGSQPYLPRGNGTRVSLVPTERGAIAAPQSKVPTLAPLPPITELRQHGLPFGLAEIPPSGDLVQGSQATPAEARRAVYATDTDAGRRGFGGPAVHAKNTRSRELRERLPLVSSASMK